MQFRFQLWIAHTYHSCTQLHNKHKLRPTCDAAEERRVSILRVPRRSVLRSAVRRVEAPPPVDGQRAVVGEAVPAPGAGGFWGSLRNWHSILGGCCLRSEFPRTGPFFPTPSRRGVQPPAAKMAAGCKKSWHPPISPPSDLNQHRPNFQIKIWLKKT